MGHLHHRLFIAWRRREGSAHRVQEPYQVRSPCSSRRPPAPHPPPPRTRTHPTVRRCAASSSAKRWPSTASSCRSSCKQKWRSPTSPSHTRTSRPTTSTTWPQATRSSGRASAVASVTWRAGPPLPRQPRAPAARTSRARPHRPVETRNAAGALTDLASGGGGLPTARALSTCARVSSAEYASASAAAAARWRTRRRASFS